MRLAEEVPPSVDPRWGHRGTYGATSQESERVFCKGPHSKYFRYVGTHDLSHRHIFFLNPLKSQKPFLAHGSVKTTVVPRPLY